MRVAILGLGFALASACVHFTPVPTPDPAEATCASVCAHGAELGCIWATPTRKGTTCEAVCENAAAAREPWRLSCLVKATSCDPLACP